MTAQCTHIAGVARPLTKSPWSAVRVVGVVEVVGVGTSPFHADQRNVTALAMLPLAQDPVAWIEIVNHGRAAT